MGFRNALAEQYAKQYKIGAKRRNALVYNAFRTGSPQGSLVEAN